MKNQQNFLLSGFAALALTLIGATPAAAEIAQRNVYRDAATTTVNSASAEEFAQLYNNSAQTTKGEIVRPADAQSALASKDFNRYSLSSKNFDRYSLSSKNFDRYSLCSKSFDRYSLASKSFDRYSMH